ncbi:MAG: sensor histidine kinase [Micropruina sp.]|nr:sensor histidine kinase [Micropruina sp.]
MTAAGLLQLWVSDIPAAPMVVLPIVAYSVARWVPGPAARIVAVVGAIGATLGPARWMAGEFSYGMSLRVTILYLVVASVCLGLIVTPYAIGRRVRESGEAHRDRVVAAEERYHLLLAEREQQGRLAESRARTMIARELHDIVAHSLSVMIVQAEGGRALAAKRPEAAVAALDTIAETGRGDLQEMRRIVGVLRAEPERRPSAPYTPAPTLADIPELVHRATDRATLRILGLPPRVSPAMELTVYRVVQEALTNFLKHAGPDATASVTLAYGYRDITIEVVDNGPGPVSSPGPSGHGLRGMAERVTSMGGRLEARPLPKGGFAVLAILPINRPQGAMR